MLLWLWCRLAVTALIIPLVWEPPYATGMALKRPKKKKKKRKKEIVVSILENSTNKKIPWLINNNGGIARVGSFENKASLLRPHLMSRI